MKIDLILAPIEHSKINWNFAHNEKENEKFVKEKYLKNEIQSEIKNLINQYNFENIYVSKNDVKLYPEIPNLKVYGNLGELANNEIKNNFFIFNNYTASFFSEQNIFEKFINLIENNSIVACPSTHSLWWTSNVDPNANNFKKSKVLYDKYFKESTKTSTDFHFTNFSFALFNIDYVKRIKFLEQNDTNLTIIDYYYRLKVNNIKVLTDLSSLIFNNAMHLNQYAVAQLDNDIERIWSNEFLHVDQYKKVYARQFWDYLLKLKTSTFKFEKRNAIMYVTTPFNWVNGMTKHVKDLISQNKDKHIYVFESPSEPRYSNEFYLNHFYNGELINVETYVINDFNHLSNLTSPQYENVLTNILREKNISLVHIHILALGHKLDIASICKKENVYTILSIHDLYYIGGEYTQESIKEQFDEELLHKKYLISDTTIYEQNWKDQVQKLFDNVDKIIFFTTKYTEIFKKFYSIDTNKVQVIEHGSNYSKRYQLANKDNKDKVFKILYFGRIRTEKGILNLIEYAKKIPNIKIYIVGTADEEILFKKIDKVKNIEYISSFNSFDQLVDIVTKLNVHAKIIPAIWHEAFNFTLSEAILLGVYPIVYDYGALSARINEYNVGKILKDSDPNTLQKLIKEIQNMSNEQWNSELDKLKNVKIPTVSEMALEYDKLYKDNIDTTKYNADFKVDYELNNKLFNKENQLNQFTKIMKFNKLLWNPRISIIRKLIYRFRSKI